MPALSFHFYLRLFQYFYSVTADTVTRVIFLDAANSTEGSASRYLATNFALAVGNTPSTPRASSTSTTYVHADFVSPAI